MLRIALYVGAVILGLVLGLGSAYLAMRQALENGLITRNGPWITLLAAGSPDADMYTRAAVALGAIGALRKEETIYFVAPKDSAGSDLRGECNYRIEGRDPDARWWSITLYDNDNFLIDNPSNRYSVSKSNVVRDADGTFAIRLSRSQTDGNWIATSSNGFRITLRLYNPGVSVTDHPASVRLPAIVRETCS